LSSSSCGQSVFVRLEFYLARVNATEPTAAGTRSPTVKKAEAKKTAVPSAKRVVLKKVAAKKAVADQVEAPVVSEVSTEVTA
jgi:hypothetical protein